MAQNQTKDDLLRVRIGNEDKEAIALIARSLGGQKKKSQAVRYALHAVAYGLSGQGIIADEEKEHA